MTLFNNIKNHKVIVSNTIYLTAIQLIALLSPLVALPYVITTIGKDNYGLIVFAQSITAYFFMFINFGLDISAVKDVSQNRNDKEKLSQIVTGVLLIKFVLFLISGFLYALLIMIIPSFLENYLLYIIVFSSAIADILFPIWYYQGVERMGILSVIKSISLLFYLSTLFFVVTQESDYIYVPMLQSFGVILSSIIGFVTLIYVEKIRLIKPSKMFIKTIFKNSIPFFVSRVSLVINSNIAQTFSGIFLGMGDVAAFDIAKKIINFALLPSQMLMQAVFPHNANKQSVSFVQKFLYTVIGITVLEILVVYFITPYAVHFFGGDLLLQSIPIVRLLLFYLFFGVLANYMGSPVLVAFGHPKPFNISVLFSTASLLLCYGVYYLFDIFTLTNLAIALILSEVVITTYRYYYCRKYKLL